MYNCYVSDSSNVGSLWRSKSITILSCNTFLRIWWSLSLLLDLKWGQRGHMGLNCIERICLCFCNSWKMPSTWVYIGMSLWLSWETQAQLPHLRLASGSVSRKQNCRGHLPFGSPASSIAHSSDSSAHPNFCSQLKFSFCFLFVCFWGGDPWRFPLPLVRLAVP